MNFETAKQWIADGKLVPHSLWILLSKETERDGYALKPATWEGPGEYQHVSVAGESLGFLVKCPASGGHLGIEPRGKS